MLKKVVCAGSTIARFSGDTVHKRLRALPEYQEKKWEQSMRRAFLKTDEDLRSSKSPLTRQDKAFPSIAHINFYWQTPTLCMTHQAVQPWRHSSLKTGRFCVPTLATRALFFPSEAKQKPCRTTTSLSTKARIPASLQQVDLSSSDA